MERTAIVYYFTSEKLPSFYNSGMIMQEISTTLLDTCHGFTTVNNAFYYQNIPLRTFILSHTINSDILQFINGIVVCLICV